MKISTKTPAAWLQVHQLHGTKWWVVLADYNYEMILDGVPTVIHIPAGYRYDRATIWWEAIITKDQLGCVGPLIHDVLCHYKGNLPEVEIHIRDVDMPYMKPWRKFTRPEVDDIFRAVMLADHVVPWRARLAWMAVKLVPNW